MADTPRQRAWVDAQLPPSFARALAQFAGLDAQHVADVDLLSATDPTIYHAARANNIDIFFTKDEDFLTLLDLHGPPPHVVWITCGNIRNAELRDLVLAAWPRVETLLRAGEPLVEIGRRT